VKRLFFRVRTTNRKGELREKAKRTARESDFQNKKLAFYATAE
jgi:hypothetical protein